MNRIVFFFTSYFALTASSSSKCPIQNSTNIVYSTVNGVGPASQIWVEDFLWWWKSHDPSIEYMAMTSQDFQYCDLASYDNLRIYVNPGGNTYDQLTAIGPVGAESIKKFVTRDQSNPSAYVGFCAGGYLASSDYIWESVYEGPDYYNYKTNPPLGLFPFTVEGSIIDIGDEQYGDQMGDFYRVVNVSNGHNMLYYGGSTFGYNGASDPTDPSNPLYDPDVEVLIYYSDFYGHYSSNIPAAWRYRNLLLTSVHPEADNCTVYDCPREGSMSTETILQNRAWLAEYMNQAARTEYRIPPVPVPPVFDTTPPHSSTPRPACYETFLHPNTELLFCDDFDSIKGTVPFGLSPQFQRNQTDYNFARPWNVSYISSWNGGTQYTAAQLGDGYAVSVPLASVQHTASITTKAFDISSCAGDAGVSFYMTGQTLSSGYLSVEYGLSSAPEGLSRDDSGWVVLQASPLYPALQSWQRVFIPFVVGNVKSFAQIRFTCAAGAAASNFCAIDTLAVTC